MGLKKNSPGCNCCATCLECSSGFRPLLGFNLTLSGVAEGSWYSLNNDCTVASTVWSTTNMSNLNTTVYMPVTFYEVSEIAPCYISARSDIPNVFTVTQSSGSGSPRNVGIGIAMNYSRSSVSSPTVSLGYSVGIGLAQTLSSFACARQDTGVATASFAGTATINTGDNCKTWITTRTISLTQTPMKTCRTTASSSACYHTNPGYQGWASVTAIIEPVWTA